MRRPEVGILALAMLASACAIPTEMPNWDVTWNLPLPDNDAQSIGVASFLPSGVTTIGSPTPTAFSATVSSVPPISRTLGANCPTCPNATAPKPAFTAPPASTTVSLAAGTSLTSATLTTGSQISVGLNNGFTFDPIRPPGGLPGTVTLTVTNGTATLGTRTLQGATSAIPAGQTSTVIVPLSGTITTSSPITVTMTMDSPAGAAGSPVTMNPSQPFTASATPTINISTATVSIAAQSLASSATPIDLTDIDSAVVRRIQNDAQNRGAIFLTFTNPFTVGANATVSFRSPVGTPVSQAITPITKNVVIPAATGGTPTVSIVTINLTGQELRRMFGRNLEVVYGGTTNAGSVTVTPAQRIGVTSRIQVNFTVREQN